MVRSHSWLLSTDVQRSRRSPSIAIDIPGPTSTVTNVRTTDPATCEAVEERSASTCPSSISPHVICRGSITHHLKEDIRRQPLTTELTSVNEFWTSTMTDGPSGRKWNSGVNISGTFRRTSTHPTLGIINYYTIYYIL